MPESVEAKPQLHHAMGHDRLMLSPGHELLGDKGHRRSTLSLRTQDRGEGKPVCMRSRSLSRSIRRCVGERDQWLLGDLVPTNVLSPRDRALNPTERFGEQLRANRHRGTVGPNLGRSVSHARLWAWFAKSTNAPIGSCRRSVSIVANNSSWADASGGVETRFKMA